MTRFPASIIARLPVSSDISVKPAREITSLPIIQGTGTRRTVRTASCSTIMIFLLPYPFISLYHAPVPAEPLLQRRRMSQLSGYGSLPILPKFSFYRMTAANLPI